MFGFHTAAFCAILAALVMYLDMVDWIGWWCALLILPLPVYWVASRLNYWTYLEFCRAESKKLGRASSHLRFVPFPDMLQVIDSFTVTARSFAAHPASAQLCGGRAGIVAIPDPEQPCPTDFPAGTPMRLHRPDGTTALLTLAAVLYPHRTVGLFFAAPTVIDIPRLSQLEALSPSPGPA